MEAKESMHLITQLGYAPQMTMVDPWYNRGTGGVREDYVEYILEIISNISNNTKHFFIWGFPEIAAQFINKIPNPLEFVCWLTWYYKNNPSVFSLAVSPLLSMCMAGHGAKKFINAVSLLN